MDEGIPSLVLILLGSSVALVALTLLLVCRVLAKISRMERSLARAEDLPDVPPASISAGESSSGGAFEWFLEEDPSRRNLAKREQFAAYRQWRQEKGLNWSK
jgi:hypothetical protein